MTATLAQILDEIADTIRNVVSQVTDVDVQVEPRYIFNPTPPCVDVYPADPSLDPETAAFGDVQGGELITVRARVQTADAIAGQDLLLAFMDNGADDLSIALALTDDPMLNGLGQIDYLARSGYTQFPVPSGDGWLLGCLWTFLVLPVTS